MFLLQILIILGKILLIKIKGAPKLLIFVFVETEIAANEYFWRFCINSLKFPLYPKFNLLINPV